MRWVNPFAAALSIMLAGVAPVAIADEKSATIKVTVSGSDGKPAKDVVVSLYEWPPPTDADSREVGRGVTGDDGSATIVAAFGMYRNNAIPPGTYRLVASDRGTLKGAEADRGNPKITANYTYAPAGQSPSIAMMLPEDSDYANVTDAAVAASRGDAAAYAKTYKKAQESLAYKERLLDEKQKAADDFARANGLQIQDLKGLEKSLKTCRAFRRTCGMRSGWRGSRRSPNTVRCSSRFSATEGTWSPTRRGSPN
jgi:hypothetical protein